MKLRIKGNSIRLRLTQSEVERFSNGNRVEDTCAFGNGSNLRYVLESSRDAEELRATLVDSCITVTIPRARAQTWAATDEVGMYGTSGAVEIAIEKDFRCTSRPEEDQSDAFPNPNPCSI